MMTRLILMASLTWLLSPGSVYAVESKDAAAEVDRLLHLAWQRDSIEPAAISEDAEYHRRVWLDLAGVAPPVWHVREFLDSDNPTKRADLIELLLGSPRHADHMASRWIDFMLPADVRNEVGQRDNVVALHDWLRGQFSQNTPYDHLVGAFLTAGGASDSGPAVFYTAHSLNPEKLAAATSRIFLGIQIQCAQCHDHPFDRWTQEDFWGYAAFFSQLSSSRSGTNNRLVLEDRIGGEVTLPETDSVVRPRYPGAAAKAEHDPTGNRRRQLTIWLASRDNPYFARAAVNRVWQHLFGRGLVDPVDAMDEANKPSHPSVMNYLADRFVESRFDLRWLYRTIAMTEAYGRTSCSTGNDPPPDSFAMMQAKTLTAEQFYDSLRQNVFHRSTAIRGNDSLQPVADSVNLREQFLTRMRSVGAVPREYPHGVVQVLGLLNGDETRLAADPDQSGLMMSMEAPFFDDRLCVETMFLATVSRFPTDQEWHQFSDYLNEAKSTTSRASKRSDLLWVLLNIAESAVCP